MTSMLRDPYPSRTHRETFLLRRKDPVVWSETPAPDWLCPDSVQRYARDGYAVFNNVFNDEELTSLLQEVQEDRLRYAAADEREVCYDEATGSVRALFAPQTVNAYYEQFMRHRYLLGFAEYVLGGEVALFQSRLDFDDGLDHAATDWHSNFEAWHSEHGMPRMRALSCLILLSECNEFNSPMMVIPRSHAQFIGMSADDGGRYDPSSSQPSLNLTPPKSLVELLTDEGGGLDLIKGAAGTVVFYDCNLLHASSANISPFPRSGLRLVYNSVDNQVQ